MPNLIWSKLSSLQLGQYAENYAKMEFASYGYEVYVPELDDHGVDFMAKSADGTIYQVQVKAARNNNYVFFPKHKVEMNERFLACCMRFVDGALPKIYIIPMTAWLTPNEVLVSHDYGKPGQTSKPEWGINYSSRNIGLLDPYQAEYFFTIQEQKELNYMEDCIFCKIAAGEIPSTKVYEDETVLAFRDLDPQAPEHVLIIPKEHIASAAEITPENSAVVAHIFEAAAKLAKELGLANGFRIVNNCGEDGVQSVQHLHFHMLGGKKMGWPPYAQ